MTSDCDMGKLKELISRSLERLGQLKHSRGIAINLALSSHKQAICNLRSDLKPEQPLPPTSVEDIVILEVGVGLEPLAHCLLQIEPLLGICGVVVIRVGAVAEARSSWVVYV